MRKKIKLYFASPLFTAMEQFFNRDVVEELRNQIYFTQLSEQVDVEIYLPQENEAINDKSSYADSKMIAQADTKELLESDLVLAILDGVTIDAGVASEIGIAYATGIPIIGLYSDVRQGTHNNHKKIEALDEIAESQFSYINLYTAGLVKSNGVIVGTVSDFIDTVMDDVKKLIKDKLEEVN